MYFSGDSNLIIFRIAYIGTRIRYSHKISTESGMHCFALFLKLCLKIYIIKIGFELILDILTRAQ